MQNVQTKFVAKFIKKKKKRIYKCVYFMYV